MHWCILFLSDHYHSSHIFFFIFLVSSWATKSTSEGFSIYELESMTEVSVHHIRKTHCAGGPGLRCVLLCCWALLSLVSTLHETHTGLEDVSRLRCGLLCHWHIQNHTQNNRTAHRRRERHGKQREKTVILFVGRDEEFVQTIAVEH